MAIKVTVWKDITGTFHEDKQAADVADLQSRLQKFYDSVPKRYDLDANCVRITPEMVAEYTIQNLPAFISIMEDYMSRNIGEQK